MKTKHKRLIIIGGFVIWGLIPASYFFFWGNPTSDLSDGVLSWWYLLCYASTILTEPVFKTINIYSPWGFAFSIYFTIQSIIYFFVGWIIARLIYSNKKSLPDSPENDRE